jgi:hypothetical protein
MNKGNFLQPGGFPMDTNVLDNMQKSYELFNKLGGLSGDLSIISGCEITGSSVSDGIVYINEELLEFKGGIISPSVIIINTNQTAIFEDGQSREIYNVRYATFGVATTSYSWASFKRAFPTKNISDALDLKEDKLTVASQLSAKSDKAYVDAKLALKEDKSVVADLLERIDSLEGKLNTIAAGAEVNVNADWNATTGDSAILNKPDIVSPFLRKGNFQLGDVALTDSVLTVTFAEIGTANYMVAGSLVSKGADFNNDNDVFWMIREKTSTSFKLCLREVAQLAQLLEFNYVIIPL